MSRVEIYYAEGSGNGKIYPAKNPLLEIAMISRNSVKIRAKNEDEKIKNKRQLGE